MFTLTTPSGSGLSPEKVQNSSSKHHGTNRRLPCQVYFLLYELKSRHIWYLQQSGGSIFDLYFVVWDSQFEENFEEVNAAETPDSVPEQPSVTEEEASAPATAQETGGVESTMQDIEDQRMYSDASTSQDFMSGIMKIVPDVEVIH